MSQHRTLASLHKALIYCTIVRSAFSDLVLKIFVFSRFASIYPIISGGFADHTHFMTPWQSAPTALCYQRSLARILPGQLGCIHPALYFCSALRSLAGVFGVSHMVSFHFDLRIPHVDRAVRIEVHRLIPLFLLR